MPVCGFYGNTGCPLAQSRRGWNIASATDGLNSLSCRWTLDMPFLTITGTAESWPMTPSCDIVFAPKANTKPSVVNTSV